MITVFDLLSHQKDSGEVWHIPPEYTVYDALRTMEQKNIGALMVVADNRLLGVFSERDYARKIILRGKSSLDTPVVEIMTTEPVIVSLDDTLEECMLLMTKHWIRHLPVLKEDQPVGMVSMRDLVHAIISAQRSRIESLENYIEGTGYGR